MAGSGESATLRWPHSRDENHALGCLFTDTAENMSVARHAPAPSRAAVADGVVAEAEAGNSLHRHQSFFPW